MFRFIGNFIFFGIIFYLLFRYLPKEQTDAVVSWMDWAFNAVVELGKWAFDKVNSMTTGAAK